MDSVRLQVLAGLVAQGGRHVDVGEGAEAPGGERLLDPGGGAVTSRAGYRRAIRAEGG